MRRRDLFKRMRTEDADAGHLALTLTRSIWVLMVAWTCTAILNCTAQFQLHAVVISVASTAFLVFCLFLVRRRRLQFPIYAVPAALLLAITWLAFEGLGLRDEVMLAVPPCILLAALLIGRRGAILFAGLSLGIVVVLYVGALEGYFQYPATPQDSRVLQAYATILITSLALLWPAVTSLREALRRARENETEISMAYAKLNEAQGMAHIGSWERDMAEQQEAWSEELYRIFEIEPESAQRTHQERLARVHPEDREKATQVLVGAMTPPGMSETVYRLQWADSRIRFVHERCETHFDDEGRPVRMIGTVQDITERRLQEEERRRLQGDLLQSQKMESVGRLAGGVAHDFNNLLTAILGFAEMAMARRESLDPQAVEALRQICRAGERAKDLTRQLLAFGRKQTLEIRPVDLNTVIEGFDKMLQRLIGEDIAIETRLDRQIGPAMADPAQVEQVLLNLAVNARDAMPQGGRLTIETRHCEVGPHHKARNAEFELGHYIMLTVSDTGCGMAPETVKMVFEPFFTTKEPGKGTGLGLATVYGIIKQHMGHITVYSEPGVGTTFRIYLPCAIEEADSCESGLPAAGEGVPSDTQTAGGETILLVEDDVVIRSLTSEMLRSLNYHVVQAKSPRDALRAAGSEHAIDLVLTDVVMPGMNGHEVATRIRATRPETKVLYMSGFGYEVLANHGISSGALHFLQKPFTIQLLSQKVRETLDAPSNAPTLKGFQPVAGGHEEIAVL